MELLSNFVCFHQYTWWKRTRICWFEKHFDYPVVYDDGLVSQRVTDFEGRKPLGILFRDFVFSLQGFEKQVKTEEAKDYCRSITFAGIGCEVPSWELLDAIKSEWKKVNSLLSLLGGKPFQNAWYLVLGYSQDDQYSCIHFLYPDRSVYYPELESKIWVRPVFHLSL
ncbi:MAG: hypothetical protein J6C85_06530 [Alphaproteobacteria bacterium]|nr:hypothetical protein [Alphaproteobacteria bacterium]